MVLNYSVLNNLKKQTVMKTISIELLSEKFGIDENNDVSFREVECESLEDFGENADIGQCWTENEITYYKIRNESDDIIMFYFGENGEIVTI